MATTPLLTAALARLGLVMRAVSCAGSAAVLDLAAVGSAGFLAAALRETVEMLRERAANARRLVLNGNPAMCAAFLTEGERCDTASTAAGWLVDAVDALATTALRLLAWPEANEVVTQAHRFAAVGRSTLDAALLAHGAAVAPPCVHPTGNVVWNALQRRWRCNLCDVARTWEESGHAAPEAEDAVTGPDACGAPGPAGLTCKVRSDSACPEGGSHRALGHAWPVRRESSHG